MQSARAYAAAVFEARPKLDKFPVRFIGADFSMVRAISGDSGILAETSVRCVETGPSTDTFDSTGRVFAAGCVPNKAEPA
jgi:hypothetical protein